MSTPAPEGPATAPPAPGPGASPGKPPSTANDDLFLPKPEVTYFRPKGADGPKFGDYRQIAEALEARKPCTKEEAQQLLKEVEAALAAQTEDIDGMTIYAGASKAQSEGAGGAPGDLYGPDRPVGPRRWRTAARQTATPLPRSPLGCGSPWAMKACAHCSAWTTREPHSAR